MAVVVGGIRPLTGFSHLCFLIGEGGGGVVQGVWSSKHSWSSILWWQLWLASGLLFVCFSFIYLVRLGGGGGHNPYSNTYIVVGWGRGGVKGYDCHAQLEKHHNHVVVAVFGIISLCKLSVIPRAGGGGSYICCQNYGANIHVLSYDRWSDPQTQLE